MKNSGSFKKGNKPWNYGRFINKECQSCFLTFKVVLCRKETAKYCSMKCSKQKGICTNTGKTHFRKMPWKFKGTLKEYKSLHWQINKKLGKASWCTFCFSTVNVEWANISNQYKDDLTDWFQLCPRCHFRYDKKGELYGQKTSLFF